MTALNPLSPDPRYVAVPVETLLQWGFVVSRISGALAGVNAAFTKRGAAVLDSVADSEREADELRSTIMGLVIGASLPAEGSQQ